MARHKVKVLSVTGKNPLPGLRGRMPASECECYQLNDDGTKTFTGYVPPYEPPKAVRRQLSRLDNRGVS